MNDANLGKLAAHEPIWELELLCADARQRSILDRVGGVPWGLPREKWPRCESCEMPLTFVGQWQHVEGRFDLGGCGSVLYAFLCTNEDTMMECHMNAVEPGSDAISRVVVVENVTAEPTYHAGFEQSPTASVVAIGWNERQESAPLELLDAELFGLHPDRGWPNSEIESESRVGITRLGGRPIWIQDPYFQPIDDPHRFRCVAQWMPHVVLAHQNIQTQPAFVALETERQRNDARMLERTIALGQGVAFVRTIGGRCGAVNGSFFNTTPENGTRLSTPLQSGVLSLLADQRSGGFCLQYFGR